jgi:hypothetical protein
LSKFSNVYNSLEVAETRSRVGQSLKEYGECLDGEGSPPIFGTFDQIILRFTFSGEYFKSSCGYYEKSAQFQLQFV